ncbi:MAG: hypothetical protein NC212_08480 [Staphylococcus sp.]|nr:hypothetical protein [Staphylococcus sp.]
MATQTVRAVAYVGYQKTGPAAVMYEVVLSASAIKYDADSGTCTPSSITPKLYKHVGEEVTEVSSVPGCYLPLYKDGVRYRTATWTPGVARSLSGDAETYGFLVVNSATEEVVAQATVAIYRDGEKGDKGDTGKRGIYIPTPRMWEDYADGYQFQAGGAGDERLDVVLREYNGKMYAYACKVNHPKSSTYDPIGSYGTLFWETGQQWTFIATKILLAEAAYVDKLTVGGIRMYDTDGNIVFEAANGDVNCNRGTFRNVRLLAGDEDGKRIELDPDTKMIAIYDEDGNQCAVLDGSTRSSAELLKDTAVTLTKSPAGEISLSVDSSATSSASKETQASAKTSTLSGAGSIKITATASVNVGVAGVAGTSVPQMVRRGELRCVVRTYNPSTTLINTRKVLVTGWSENTGNPSAGSAQKTATFSVNVPPGYHQIFFELTGAGAAVSGKASLGAATFVSDQVMGHFFSGGLGVTRDTLNYLLALYEGNIMKLMLGGEFWVDKIKQPKVVYAAQVTDTSEASGTAPSTRVFTSLPGSTVEVAKQKSAADGYMLTFPAEYGLKPANCFVHATGIGSVAGSSSSPAKASVSVAAAGSMLVVNVVVSDDNSPNYGGFFIEVKKY